MSGMSFFGKIKYVIQRLANRRQQREDEIFRRIVKEKMGEYEAKQKAAAQPKQSKFNVMDTLKDNQHQRVHNNTSSSQSSSSTPPPTAAQKRHMEKVEAFNKKIDSIKVDRQTVIKGLKEELKTKLDQGR